MLELSLNLLWVAVAVTGFALLRRSDVSRAHTVRPALALVALGCVMVLLFPVISATDDLHTSHFAIEDANSARKVLKTLQAQRHIVSMPSVPGFAALPSIQNIHPLLQQIALIPPTNHAGSELLFLQSVPDRAPPAIF